MNAIDLLVKQHQEAKDLLASLEDAEVEDKDELFEKLADALAVHAAIEERHFYPATKDDRTEELLQEAVEEHLSVKRLIADLLDMPPSDAQFDAKVKVLKEQVEHHIEEEEGELFPKVKKAHSSQELEDLGVTLADASRGGSAGFGRGAFEERAALGANKLRGSLEWVGHPCPPGESPES